MYDKNKVNNQCRQKNFDTIQLLLPKGQRDVLKQLAKYYGMSLNQYIIRCIDKENHIEQAPTAERGRVTSEVEKKKNNPPKKEYPLSRKKINK